MEYQSQYEESVPSKIVAMGKGKGMTRVSWRVGFERFVRSKSKLGVPFEAL